MAYGENDPFTLFKNFYSTIALIFSVVCIHGLIFTQQTGLSENNSIIAVVVLWAAIFWLAMIEGGQASHVGLAPIDENLYKDSHPTTYKISAACNKGDNLDRYLLGRQFGVIFVVFCVNLSGGPIGGASLWGLPEIVQQIFFSTGFAMILFTCMVGQLNTQVNASICMIDFINNYVSLFTFWCCMVVEFVGIVHSSYAIQMAIGSMAGQPIESKEPPKEGFTLMFFWLRVLWSFGLLGFSLTVTIAALFEGKTTMWDGVPEIVSLILFFGLMSVVGMLEGMQIAFFYVAKLSEEERGSNSWANRTCDLLYNKRNGLNLPGFMIGRQLSVVTCFFVVARVTTQSVEDGETNVLGLPDPVQNFLNFGFQGALITTILGSITWQLVAAVFPVAFLSTPITYILLRICLFFEWTGICNGAWVIAGILKSLFGYQLDEVYIGTPEERKARGMKDDSQREIAIPALSGFNGLPNFHSAPKSLRDLAESDPEVGAYLSDVAGSMKPGAPAAAAPAAPAAASYADDDDEVEC
mmetsp:Transcript_5249/g.8084  ORF Transcript_5249/g.8084 Transcript_5249/m.8084 type:complete len:524 (+) Transcript_5249:75-1646(+)